MQVIEIYTGPGCAHCETAKSLLCARGLTFTERDVSAPNVMAELRERLPRAKSIPQIFIDGAHIGNDKDLRFQLSG